MELLKSEWLSHSWPDCDMGNFWLEFSAGGNFFMACLQAKAMVKLHPIAMVAPKPIMAWVTASTERDCQKKGFILKDASPRLAKSPASPLLAKCDASPLLAKFHH